ncbi:tail fiber assembly protein [Serratia rubidaea]|uniref:tail fiber assembly protein n=1 Tax=Serratia rubidaea TaxID=61652 RepID=UPI001BB05EAC|nr:tail fiber assembly protein [Serratia rubidaea]MBS0972747.1 tail fiber assembly protein [Serratia rubidaea]
MSYGYSATTTTFYVMEDKAGYVQFGNWPEDVKPVSNEVWETFIGQGAPGKMRGAGDDGLPAWVDIPAPTQEQEIESAKMRKMRLMAEATRAIAPLQDAEDLGVATAEEKAALIAWKTYRVQLNRITPQDAPDIEWPHTPDA